MKSGPKRPVYVEKPCRLTQAVKQWSGSCCCPSHNFFLLPCKSTIGDELASTTVHAFVHLLKYHIVTSRTHTWLAEGHPEEPEKTMNTSKKMHNLGIIATTAEQGIMRWAAWKRTRNRHWGTEPCFSPQLPARRYEKGCRMLSEEIKISGFTMAFVCANYTHQNHGFENWGVYRRENICVRRAEDQGAWCRILVKGGVRTKTPNLASTGCCPKRSIATEPRGDPMAYVDARSSSTMSI